MYTFAKNKVNREGETQLGAPSCIDCYASSNREEAATRLSTLMCAYIKEVEQRSQAKRNMSVLLESEVLRQLKTSNTTYYGNRGRATGIIRRT
jgi:hypothetical protein